MPLPAVIHWTSPAAMAPLVPHAVAVIHGAGEDVGNGLDSAVRVPGKPCQIVFRNIIAKIIEEQKGIEIGSVAEAEGTAQMYARAFHASASRRPLVLSVGATWAILVAHSRTRATQHRKWSHASTE